MKSIASAIFYYIICIYFLLHVALLSFLHSRHVIKYVNDKWYAFNLNLSDIIRDGSVHSVS